MTNQDLETRLVRRRLIVRDSLFFLMLAAVCIALFFVTLFLFRSFSAHRVDLAKRWYDRGARDLAAHLPAQAVTDLQTALAYAPEQRSYQLLLAEALSDVGNTAEAYSYFMNLWEVEPGSGLLNLQLARLSAKMGRADDAVHSYRASIYGTWEGDGTVRRREVRMELIRYLLDRQDYAKAQAELLIAAGNTSEDALARLQLAKLMLETGDDNAALAQYEKVMYLRPTDWRAYEEAGQLAFRMGHYSTAHRDLEDAERRHAMSNDGTLSAVSRRMLSQSARILELFPGTDLPANQRLARIVEAIHTVQNRLKTCHAQVANNASSVAVLQPADALWNNGHVGSVISKLRGDLQQQDAAIQNIFQTEQITREVCGEPNGDDQLLLLTSRSPAGVMQ